MAKAAVGRKMETLDIECQCDSLDLGICFRDRTKSVGYAERVNANVLDIEQLGKPTDIALESYLGSGIYNPDNQPIGIMECKFSIEFCRRSRHHVGRKSATTSSGFAGKIIAISRRVITYFGGCTNRNDAIDVALFWENEQLFCSDQFDCRSRCRSPFMSGFQHVSHVMVRSWQMARSGNKMVHLDHARSSRVDRGIAFFNDADKFIQRKCSRALLRNYLRFAHVARRQSTLVVANRSGCKPGGSFIF